MRRVYAILLILALVYWLVPTPVEAQEKYTFTSNPSNEPAWVVEPDYEVAERLYQEWLKEKQAKPIKVVKASQDRITKFRSGYCTDYVARKVPVTWMGNANRWIANAKAQGYLVDKHPVSGAILVTNESKYGHVAYIENVNGTSISISEWNYTGLYKLTYRIIDISDRRIMGVIHLKNE